MSLLMLSAKSGRMEKAVYFDEWESGHQGFQYCVDGCMFYRPTKTQATVPEGCGFVRYFQGLQRRMGTREGTESWVRPRQRHVKALYELNPKNPSRTNPGRAVTRMLKWCLRESLMHHLSILGWDSSRPVYWIHHRVLARTEMWCW